tara:strand:- start:125 stop:781 length:657 start_codon:yes stop_codon:yes gene_type:complete
MKSELSKRILTSLFLITIVIGCLFISKLTWLLLLITISIISWFEIINLFKKIFKKKIAIFNSNLISILYLTFFIFSAYSLLNNYNYSLVLFILFICVFSDIGGYVIGKSIGGKKLTKISPNKTVSGSIGSFIFSLFPIVILIILNDNEVKEFLPINLVLSCLVISLLSQVGDLIVSYIKRLSKVKDTGNILPGHGGLLDRIDGIIFTIPLVYIILLFL